MCGFRGAGPIPLGDPDLIQIARRALSLPVSLLHFRGPRDPFRGIVWLRRVVGRIGAGLVDQAGLVGMPVLPVALKMPFQILDSVLQPLDLAPEELAAESSS